MQITANVQRYIRDDAAAHSSIDNYDFTGWSLYLPLDTPQQEHGSNDCGVFMCKMCQSRVLRGLTGGLYRSEFAFASRDTADIRQEMLAESLVGDLCLN